MFHVMSDFPNQPTLLMLKNIVEFATGFGANGGYSKTLSPTSQTASSAAGRPPRTQILPLPTSVCGPKVRERFLRVTFDLKLSQDE